MSGERARNSGSPPDLRRWDFILPGQPVAWQRVGSGPRGGRHTYVPREVVQAEQAIGWAYLSAGGPLLEGPVSLSCFFFVSGFSVEACKDPRDLDNLVKTVKDGLARIAYPNDRRVIGLYALKLIDSDRPRTRVVVAPGVYPDIPLFREDLALDRLTPLPLRS